MKHSLTRTLFLYVCALLLALFTAGPLHKIYRYWGYDKSPKW